MYFPVCKPIAKGVWAFIGLRWDTLMKRIHHLYTRIGPVRIRTYHCQMIHKSQFDKTRRED